jgi:hypothetical protein
MYNHSLRSADRATHLKIVLVPLVAVALLAAAGLHARLGDGGARAEGNAAVHAGHSPSLYASSTSVVIR